MSIVICPLPPETECVENGKITPKPLLFRMRERIATDPQCATMYSTGSITQAPGGQVMDYSHDAD